MMESGTLRLGGDDAVFVIRYNDQGWVDGFLRLAPGPRNRSLSQLARPWWWDTPHPFAACLSAKAVPWACGRRQELVTVASKGRQPETVPPGAISLTEASSQGGRHGSPRRIQSRPAYASRS
jgi:hypothetical protein